MKTITAALAAIVGATLAGGAVAQTAPLGPANSGAEIAAAVARAKAAIKPGQPASNQNLISVPPYTAHVEYRPIVGPAAIHEAQAEFFYILDGAGTLTTGGTLVEPGAPNRGTIQGKAITGGETRPVGKGDMFIVPEKTPHWFNTITSPLVVISMYMPRGG